MIVQYIDLAVADTMAMIDGQSTGVVEDNQFGQHNLVLVEIRLRWTRVLPAYTGRGLISNPDQSLVISGRSLGLRI